MIFPCMDPVNFGVNFRAVMAPCATKKGPGGCQALQVGSAARGAYPRTGQTATVGMTWTMKAKLNRVAKTAETAALIRVVLGIAVLLGRGAKRGFAR